VEEAAMQVERASERDAWALPGIAGLALVLFLGIAGIVLFIAGAANEAGAAIILGVVLLTLATFSALGFLVLQPNQANVLIVLGSYQGTLRAPGWWWTNPLSVAERRRISLRARNFNSTTSKVNDANGNPIHIAAVVVWQVVDTAKAVFDVDDYEDFVVVQTETAVRNLARSYPYDYFGDEENVRSLVGSAEEIAETLQREVQERLETAGVHVIEARLTDLAYAPEIAEAMLRRQQASAIVAARKRIVEGAVGMVELALAALETSGVVQLDEERKATMVSNLLTVLTSDQPTSPIVNVGTLNR
jgi:regulator of protease activity HflC (stomatin/prohibitin superfamily)